MILKSGSKDNVKFHSCKTEFEICGHNAEKGVYLNVNQPLNRIL